MAMACEICTRTYNSEFFDSIDADSSDVEFQQIITFECLSSLLTWAKNKHQLLKSSRSSESSDVGIPSLSSIVHTVIRKIDTFGSVTSSSEIRLKTTLPQSCDLNRAVRRALTQRRAVSLL